MCAGDLCDPIFGGKGDDVGTKAKDALVQFISRVHLDGVTLPAWGRRFYIQWPLRAVNWLTVEIMREQGGSGPMEFLDPF